MTAATTQISPRDTQAIETHLPPQVRGLLNGREYKISHSELPCLFPDASQITLHVLPQNQGVSVSSIISPLQKWTSSLMLWSGGKCKHDAYRLYTKNAKPLDQEAVNDIYVFCLQRLIRDMGEPKEEGRMALPAALLAQTRADKHPVSESDLDMQFLSKVMKG